MQFFIEAGRGLAGLDPTTLGSATQGKGSFSLKGIGCV